MKKIPRPTCSSCNYWERIPTLTTGYCKRNSPRNTEIDVITSPSYFCGEHNHYLDYECAVEMTMPKCVSCKHLGYKNPKLQKDSDHTGRCEIFKRDKWKQERGCYLHEKIK